MTTRRLKYVSGLVVTPKGDSYVFRSDHGYYPGIWAWNIHDIAEGDRFKVHKWMRIPKGSYVCAFDLDNPPCTVPYLPIMH